jgi:hypothetical protein
MKTTTTNSRSVELRKANRYQLSVPVFFFWVHKSEPEEYGAGVTRDINTSGVYVITKALPPVGARVLMDILLPKLTQAGNGMHITGEGVVIRVEPGTGKDSGATDAGFAASLQFYPERSELVLEHLKCSGRVV